jgi:O-antigen/teichoic acid export membrane protein
MKQGLVADDRVATVSVPDKSTTVGQAMVLVVLAAIVIAAGLALAVIAWAVALPLLVAGLIWLAVTRKSRPDYCAS